MYLHMYMCTYCICTIHVHVHVHVGTDIRSRHTHKVLTQHDFIGGDNNIELVGLGNDLSSRVSIEHVILVNETTTVGTVVEGGREGGEVGREKRGRVGGGR